MEKRKPIQVAQSDVSRYLKLQSKDITMTLIMETFGTFNGKEKYHTYDELEIPAGAYTNGEYKNESAFKTTLGTWFFNILFIKDRLMHIFGYINDETTSKFIKKMNSKLSYARLENDIEIEDLEQFMMKTQSSMSWVTVLATNQTLTMLTLSNKTKDYKMKLYNKYKSRIDAGDPDAAEQMEKELLDYAANLLKDDESYDWIKSGYRASWGNNIKCMYLMKGAMKDPITGKYNIALSNYSSGMSKDEYKYFCNALSAGPYSRARKTAIGGYWEKLILAAYQHFKLLPKDSDCGTKRLLEVDFSKENINDYIYSFVYDKGELVEITSKNLDKYDGKKVKIRFSSLCESHDGICNKCAGNFIYRLEKIENVGITFPRLGSILKNISMKAFHDSTVSLHTLNLDEAFEEIRGTK